MKRLILIIIILFLAASVRSQGLFKPVGIFPTSKDVSGVERIKLTDFKWAFRFDGTFQLNENLYNKETQNLESKMAAGVGFAIGFQHYVPTSAIDPTPKNNYGFSLGLLQQNQLKIVGQVNIWQYIKFGPTFTPNQPEPYGKWGFFIGTGITL